MITRRCRLEAFRILRGSHDAEEVLQEALARAWRNAGSCRSPEAPMPWCLEITRNEARRLIGRRRPVASIEALELDGELSDARALDEVDRIANRLDVARALHGLTGPERLLLALRYEHDYSHPEIAARLKISETAARIRLHRLHKRIKPLLQAHS